MDRPGRLRTFAYVDVPEKAELYRAVMRTFAAAKERFALHLRPAEVVGALLREGWEVSPSEVDAALHQLACCGKAPGLIWFALPS
jgi:hypothetical protein